MNSQGQFLIEIDNSVEETYNKVNHHVQLQDKVNQKLQLSTASNLLSGKYLIQAYKPTSDETPEDFSYAYTKGDLVEDQIFKEKIEVEQSTPKEKKITKTQNNLHYYLRNLNAPVAKMLLEKEYYGDDKLILEKNILKEIKKKNYDNINLEDLSSILTDTIDVNDLHERTNLSKAHAILKREMRNYVLKNSQMKNKVERLVGLKIFSYLKIRSKSLTKKVEI